MIKKSLIAFISIIITISFTACTTTGNTQLADVNRADVKMDIIKKVSNMHDISELYGEPTSVTTENGLEVWTYTFSSERESIPSYIPLVKSLSSGVKKVKKELVIYFNDEGNVDDYKFDSKNIESNTGLLH